MHPKAKAIIIDIMKIFSKNGFQFIIVDHDINKLHKMYLVEKPNTVATITALDYDYDGEVFKFNKPEGYDEEHKEIEEETV